MYSQSLGDGLKKYLFKGRCYPVLPWNIPWDLESCSLDSGITLSGFRLTIHSFSIEEAIPSVWLQHPPCTAVSQLCLGHPTLFPSFECIFLVFFKDFLYF